MFDEYDEGTAIAPAADSYLSVPIDQYFLTYSADGTYIAPDFYMRLAGEITRMIKKEIPVSSQLHTKYSEGPVYFRTSVETGYDAMPNWLNTLDQTSILTNVSGPASGGKPFCALSTTNAKTGARAIKFEGTDQSSEISFAYMKVFDVNIPVSTDTWLSFMTFPENELSRHCTIDLIMTDGSTLRDSGAEDEDGVSMHPGALHGILNEWSETSCDIGLWLAGKTIDRILIAFDNGPGAGDFRCYFDDITVSNKEIISAIHDPNRAANVQALISYPNPTNSGMVTLDLSDIHDSGNVLLQITNAIGQQVLRQYIPLESHFQINMKAWPKGVYFVTMDNGQQVFTGKVVYCP